MQADRLVCLAVSEVAGLLVGVDMPNDVVGQANDLVASALGHLGETLGFGLVLERVRGEVDAFKQSEHSSSNQSVSTYLCGAHRP